MRWRRPSAISPASSSLSESSRKTFSSSRLAPCGSSLPSRRRAGAGRLLRPRLCGQRRRAPRDLPPSTRKTERRRGWREDVLIVVVGGQHDDAGAWGPGGREAGGFDAVHAGHDQVHQRVWSVLGREPDGLLHSHLPPHRDVRPRVSRNALTPRLTSSWSSTSRTVIGSLIASLPCVQRADTSNPGPFARRTLDLDAPAEPHEPFAHALKAEALARVLRGVEAAPIVGDAEGQGAGGVDQVNLRPVRSAVPGDVRKGLLRDAEERLYLQRRLSFAPDVDLGRDLGLCDQPLT